MHSASLVAFSSLCLLLLLLPLPLHIRARNTGTLLLIGWLFCGDTLTLVNSLLFWNSVVDVAPVWCDISVKLSVVGCQAGFAAASLSINRRLAAIARSTSVSLTQRQRRISLAIDLTCGIAVPIILMAMSYIVQAHRFDLIEGMGPVSPNWPCIAEIFILYVPTLILLTVSVIYGSIAILFFFGHRRAFKDVLKAAHSGLDTSNYIRLMAIASADLLMSIPIAIAFLVLGLPALRPWHSWSFIHADFGHILQISVDEFPLYFGTLPNLAMAAVAQWLSPMLTCLFFLFFGVSKEAMNGYARMLAQFRKVKQGQTINERVHRPNLGSKIVRSQESRWGDSTVPMAETSNTFQEESHIHPAKVATYTAGGSGIAITVERETV